MILLPEDYPGLKEEKDLNNINISSYYKKLEIVVENNVKVSETAKKIMKVIEENYPQYFV